MKYRLKYKKGEEIKFISHLDMMKLFQRAVKRAGLPIAYSQGFNPHQQLFFSHPLSLGFTSEGEYGDFEMTEEIAPEDILRRLNQTLPRGTEILSCIKMKEGQINAMAAVQAVGYEVFLDKEIDFEDIKKGLLKFLSQSEIIVMKKTKKQMKETNIRPLILQASAQRDEDIVKLQLLLSGGEANLRPDTFVEAFFSYLNKQPYNKYALRFHRKDLYSKTDRGYESLDGKVVIE